MHIGAFPKAQGVTNLPGNNTYDHSDFKYSKLSNDEKPWLADIEKSLRRLTHCLENKKLENQDLPTNVWTYFMSGLSSLGLQVAYGILSVVAFLTTINAFIFGNASLQSAEELLLDPMGADDAASIRSFDLYA